MYYNDTETVFFVPPIVKIALLYLCEGKEVCSVVLINEKAFYCEYTVHGSVQLHAKVRGK